MKKAITGSLIFISIVAALGFGAKYAMDKYWADNYGGPSYYTKITSIPEDTGTPEDESPVWQYDQISYNEDGQEKIVHLKEARPQPLKEGAYLKMVVNENKGVTSWEEVKAAELPKKVAEKLESEGDND
ncbi:YxeA family protein [Enterococcus sp. LJL51]|uniref:YxeA family protein n=1 Tax=Enterococcus sp. LJL51 TaxID=3416656 RepID=UPI003CE9F428